MIYVIRHLVDGPYRPGEEARLKADVIRARESRNPRLQHFCTETEGTEPGFPDVLSVQDSRYLLIEFKVSDASGVLHFQRSQPIFYKKYREVTLCIAAWDVPGARLLLIDPEDIVQAKSARFRCPKGSVPVCAANLNRDRLSLLPGEG
jgi:hypothetical protein